jgi:hypothetical protein
MEPPQLEHRPLTFGELQAMLERYVENAEVSKVIEAAMKRRLSDIRKDFM